MKTIFDKTTREGLILRINNLDETCTAQWGKMNLYQMLRHCVIWEEWIAGKNNPTYKQEFLGRIFGRMALNRMIRDEKPFDRNVPTSAQFQVKETTGNLAELKQQWIGLLNEYDNYSNPAFIHDFFGKMTTEQVGYLAYKHTDHHLRQFNR